MSPTGAALTEAPWERRRHWELLIICSLVVMAANCLRVGNDEQRVAILGYHALTLPETCGSRAIFGVECPGCGLTRSVIYFGEGRWRQSLEMHRLGWLMAIMILLQIPYRIICLLRPNRNPLPRRLRSIIAYTLITGIVGNWVIQLTAG